MSNKYVNEYVKSGIKIYLKHANIYDDNSNKKKTDLVEMFMDVLLIN